MTVNNRCHNKEVYENKTKKQKCITDCNCSVRDWRVLWIMSEIRKILCSCIHSCGMQLLAATFITYVVSTIMWAAAWLSVQLQLRFQLLISEKLFEFKFCSLKHFLLYGSNRVHDILSWLPWYHGWLVHG